MNGRISKLIRRNARAMARRYADNPPNYTHVPGSVRLKPVHTGELLSNGLPEVILYQTCTLRLRRDTLRFFVNVEKDLQRQYGTRAYIDSN